MSIETINDGGMMEALDELLEQFQNGGPDTKQRIAPVIVKRAKAAEGKLQSVKRNFWSAVCDLWSDEEADDRRPEFVGAEVVTDARAEQRLCQHPVAAERVHLSPAQRRLDAVVVGRLEEVVRH